MIGTSTAEYVFIRTCISILHCIAPISILYWVLITIDSASAFRMRPPIELWLIAEALFCTCFFLPYQWYLQHPATHPSPRSKEERRKLVDCVKAEVAEPEQYIRGWFKGANIEDIGRRDFKEWLTWAFFDCFWEEGTDESEIEEYTLEFETMLGKPFRPGKGVAKSTRLTIDRVDMLHRSLFWYFVSTPILTSYSFRLIQLQCVGTVDFLAYLKLQRLGFDFHRLSLANSLKLFPCRPVSLMTRYRSPAKHLSYWYRPHTSTTRLPILFIHGIGIGLYPYTDFFSDINSIVHDNADNDDGHIGILAVEIMPISFRITHSMLDKDVLCTELRQIIAEHSYDSFLLVSHSYGSVISTFILADQILRPKVASALFVDPVNFLLHMPDVAHNFTVRQPQRANEWQLWYFASKDPGVAHALGRHFFWSQNVMWNKDVEDFVHDGKRLTVSLGGKDLIVKTEAVRSYLTSSGANQARRCGVGGNHEDEGCVSSYPSEDSWERRIRNGNGLEVLWFEQLDHGQAFDKIAARARLVKVAQDYCKKG